VVGATLGFVAVLPMGFGGRFFTFNIHWPLACLGGVGLGQLAGWVEKRSSLRLVSQVFLLCVGVIGLIAFPSLDLMLGQPGPGAPIGAKMLHKIRPHWRLGVQAGMLPRLMESNPRIRPGPAPGPVPGSQPGPPPGPDPGAGGMDMIHQPGAEEFFEAIRHNVGPADVIFVEDPPVASLITGVRGRWTSNGILPDVLPAKGPTLAEDCHFAAVVRTPRGQGPQPIGPSRPPRADTLPGFEKIFENAFGSLWRNSATPKHGRQPSRASLSLPVLLTMLAVGLLLTVLDMLPTAWRKSRFVGVFLGTIVVTICLMPLLKTAGAELRHPPEEPPQRREHPRQVEIPEDIRHKHDILLDAVRDRIERGISPDHFWHPENEEHFRRLIERGQLQEAAELLDSALQSLSDKPGDYKPLDQMPYQ